MPVLSGGRIGQAIYTWSKQTPAGAAGFGFSSISPLLKGRLSWLETWTAPARSFPAFTDDGSAIGEAQGSILPTRYVVDGTSVVAFKTYQGVDGNNRPGNYACQMLVGDPFDLPLSAAILASERARIAPETPSLVSGSISAVDFDVRELHRTPPLGASIEVTGILERLASSGWTSVDFSSRELSAIPMLMGILGESWDAAATLDISKSRDSTSLSWRLSLPEKLERLSPSSTTWLSTEGDQDWVALRDRLRGAVSRKDLQRAWRSPRPATVDDVVTSGGMDEVEEALVQYLERDGTALEILLRGADNDSYVLKLDQVVQILTELDRTLETRGRNVQHINRWVLADSPAAKKELRGLVPTDRQRVNELAQAQLTEALLEEVVYRNSRASSKQVIALHYVSVEPGLWDAIANLWAGPQLQKEGLLRTLRASGSGDRGLLRCVADQDSAELPADLVFGELIPRAFTPREAFPLVQAFEIEFLRWTGIPSFYWESLRPTIRGAGLLHRFWPGDRWPSR